MFRSTTVFVGVGLKLRFSRICMKHGQPSNVVTALFRLLILHRSFSIIERFSIFSVGWLYFYSGVVNKNI